MRSHRRFTDVNATHARTRRRTFIQRGLLLVPSALGVVSCASLLGEETIDAWFVVGEGGAGPFHGWNTITLPGEAGEDDVAELRRVELIAPSTTNDVRFVLNVLSETVLPTGERTPLAQGQGFPENQPVATLDILYRDNLRPFFADGKSIRIEWTGNTDPAYPYPPEGLRVDVAVTVEIL